MKTPIQIRTKILEIDKKINQIEKSVGMCSIDEAVKKAEIIDGYRDIRKILEWVLS